MVLENLNICRENNVFINCPFDDEYIPLLRPLLFTIIYLEKEPLISMLKDSSKNRLEEIIELMKQAKYSIHDLSRIKGKNPRFNMPLELGIDLGLIHSKQKLLKEKIILILESKKYSLIPIMSDIAGNDVMCHNNNPKEIIECVRNWHIATTKKTNIAYSEEFHFYYDSFLENFNDRLKTKGISILKIKNLTYAEIINDMKK
jgi:hypothetical protein